MNIAIFASGGGSNAAAILKHFEGHDCIRVALMVTNNPNAGALDVASNYGIETLVVNREMLYRSQAVLDLLEDRQIAFIALAGFLWRIPNDMLNKYPSRIVNIHPSLLPKYGGKGMYGHHVHNAVKASGDRFSGLTIHYVSEEYDAGQIIIQLKCPVYPSDSAEDIAARVLRFEHVTYPITIQDLVERLMLRE